MSSDQGDQHKVSGGGAENLLGLAAKTAEYFNGKSLQEEADLHYKRDEAYRAKKRVEEDLPKFKAERLAKDAYYREKWKEDKEEERAQEEYNRMRDEKERVKKEEALEEAREPGRRDAHRRSEDEEMDDEEHFEK